jgi:choline kinase
VPLQFVVNERYDLKNGLSVLAAAEFVGDSFLLTMSDHVFGDEVMRRAGGHTPPENGASLVVDYRLDTIFDMDDATKVKERNGLIVEIGKDLHDFDCVDTGLFICTPALMTALRQAVDTSGDVSLSQGVEHLARAGRMSVVDIGDGFWQDIDTPAMLEHAERMLEAHGR